LSGGSDPRQNGQLLNPVFRSIVPEMPISTNKREEMILNDCRQIAAAIDLRVRQLTVQGLGLQFVSANCRCG
jgi:hypothetical protein